MTKTIQRALILVAAAGLFAIAFAAGSVGINITHDATLTGTGSAGSALHVAAASASGAAYGVFGTGTDGALTYDGSTTVLGVVPSGSVYTLTADVHAASIAVSTGVTIKENGFRMFSTGACTGTGTAQIQDDGNPGAAGPTNGSGTGAGGVQRTAGFFPVTQAGTTGGNSTGTDENPPANVPAPFVRANQAQVNAGAAASANGVGGNGNNGNLAQGGSGGGGGGTSANTGVGAGGNVTALTIPTAAHGTVGLLGLTTGTFEGSFLTTQWNFGSGGAGGGVGAANSGGVGGGGGGGGAEGGEVYLACKTLAGAWNLHANGGAGGVGGNGFSAGAQAAGGGGGGGGAGGVVVVVYSTSTATLTTTAAGGTGGTGGAGFDGGQNGGNGGNGHAGAVVKFNLSGDGT